MKLLKRLGSFFSSSSSNPYNQAFFQWLGNGFSSYDVNGKTYVEKGFNKNPLVYSVVNQIATKASSIPFHIKKIKDKTSKRKADNLLKATNYDLSPFQRLKLSKLITKAYGEDFLNIPLERPNPLQTWKEWIELYEVFLKLTGNIYIYLLSPENGSNKGRPVAWYLLPSHLMQIVIKDKVDLHGLEDPVDHYILIEGNQYVEFRAENVVHVKYANPNFDTSGSHLYGLGPMRSAIMNVQSSNEAINQNAQTMQNAGAFGFVHSKNTPWDKNQTDAIKQKMVEMDKSQKRLSNITAVSSDMGFMRLTLNPDQLKPFDFLAFDLKQICAVFGWDDKLMGNDSGAKYDNYVSAQKRCLIGSVVPDLKLLEEAIKSQILPRYKGYEQAEWRFDISDLPEMQEDMNKLSEWTTRYKDKGIMTANEVRVASGMARSDDPLMDEYTTNEDLMTIEESLADPVTV